MVSLNFDMSFVRPTRNKAGFCTRIAPAHGRMRPIRDHLIVVAKSAYEGNLLQNSARRAKCATIESARIDF
jgi:hypothetical protein